MSGKKDENKVCAVPNCASIAHYALPSESSFVIVDHSRVAYASSSDLIAESTADNSQAGAV